eukprot:CAMPEP_0114620946 /NCGR_PEP_ID=MMETSP0168-20121206/8983_1 /TAXON_ID=95228 ORGANISM="Vannella sp., Strain DIVA3 517/6/12" /NCGR_SAMPLE_ID=MMETSP0168 /ASSEMBLY_ACC=CAM_ASM_000044 /LENGTH=215 /DNA_ID=CAMNT_0001832145 /DNA_START=31 /DNA_END=678 /DNA_ORIENTATION=+
MEQAQWLRPEEFAACSGPLPTGFVAFCATPLFASDLPSPAQWVWNQSGSSQVHALQTMEVRMTKLIPRLRRRHAGDRRPQLPSYKIWLMTLLNESEVYFVWVERGEDTTKVTNFAAMVRDQSSLPVPWPGGPVSSLAAPAQVQAPAAVTTSLPGVPDFGPLDHSGITSRTSSWPRATAHRATLPRATTPPPVSTSPEPPELAYDFVCHWLDEHQL